MKPLFYTKHLCYNSKHIYPEIEEFFQLAVFDPGTVSCGLRIVRYNIISKTYTLIFFSTLNFGIEISDIMINLPLEINKIANYLEDCHHIIIEKQIMKCIKIYQTFSSLLYHLVGSICENNMRPMLIQVDCMLKTSFLDGPRTKKENNSDEMKEWIFKKNGTLPQNGSIEIKEWTKMKSRELCIKRNDSISYHTLENSKYKGNEDLSDTVCYEYAWFVYLMQNEDIFIPFCRKFIL